MVFSSITFLCYYFPICITCYFLLGRRLKNVFLLVMSLLFYAWGAPKFIPILVASTVLDFFLVRAQHQASEQRTKRWYLIASVVLNLGLLAYFKYANFFVDNVNALLEGIGLGAVPWMEVMLPIGISFYVFQSITYAVDVYRGVSPPQKSLVNYLLYILMFPQLIAGPIVRYNTIAAEISQREDKVDNYINGFIRFAIGLGKKVLIANVLGEYADEIIKQSSFYSLNSTEAWIALSAYTFQIYFDFSGYSDMAIGLGRIFGFTFPENFNLPYLATSITEFWRRWHITLSAFMRDYLYIPLGGNRNGNLRTYANLCTVFLLSGLWHGASWNFVLWGAFHGFFLILDRLFLKRVLDRIWKPLAVVFTFFLVMVGWALFCIEDGHKLPMFLEALFAFDFGPTDIQYLDKLWVFMTLAAAFSFLPGFRPLERVMNWTYKEHLTLGPQTGKMMIALVLVVLSFSFIVASDFNPFIYYRF